MLIVEDEPAMREVTRRILSRSGYNVLVAATGPEAIQKPFSAAQLLATLGQLVTGATPH